MESKVVYTLLIVVVLVSLALLLAAAGVGLRVQGMIAPRLLLALQGIIGLLIARAVLASYAVASRAVEPGAVVLGVEVLLVGVAALIAGGVLALRRAMAASRGQLAQPVEEHAADLAQSDQAGGDSQRTHDALEQQYREQAAELHAAKASLEREIAERMRAEQALRQSENQLRTTLDALDDIVYVVDADLRIRLCNAAFMRFAQDFGLETNPIGRVPFEVFPFLPNTLVGQFQQVFERGETVVDVEHFAVGQMVLINEVRKIPITSEGRVTHVVTVIHDITEREGVQKALRVSEARYRMISDVVTDFAFAFRVTEAGAFELEWVTDALATITGYASDDVRDIQGWRNMVHPDDLPVFEKSLAKLRAGQADASEYRLVARSGTVHWVRASARPQRDPDTGRVIRVIGGVTEITDRKRAEQQALQLRVERERSAILSDFIRDISHEFASPLSVIKNTVYVMQRAPDESRLTTLLDRIREQVHYLEELVAGLLTMSQLDGGVAFRFAPLDLAMLMRSLHEAAQSMGEKAGLDVTLEMPGALPELHADRDYLRRGLREIIRNAVQHTPPGGTIALSVALENSEPPGFAVLTVRDSGSGIAETDLPRIFERFYRADKARAKRGAGLGLAIAQRIIERHGGRVTVESTPGAGSTFRVFLPIHHA